jgi:hypothetical protein
VPKKVEVQSQQVPMDQDLSIVSDTSSIYSGASAILDSISSIFSIRGS